MPRILEMWFYVLALAFLIFLTLPGCCVKPTIYNQQYYLDALGVELDKEEGKE